MQQTILLTSNVCAITCGFQTTTQDLSVFPFLPRHYHMTHVLQLPYITTVWTPVVLAVINIIQATLKMFMMTTMMMMTITVLTRRAGWTCATVIAAASLNTRWAVATRQTSQTWLSLLATKTCVSNKSTLQ